MRRLTGRILLVSLIAVGALVALYPRVPAPSSLVRVSPVPAPHRAAGPAPVIVEPVPAGPRMPTYRPPAGTMERMPVAGPMPSNQLRLQRPDPRPSPGPIY
jgi:hypothetical protein